jgi:CheY-like chemotaxis protein/GAF domain-containing protein
MEQRPKVLVLLGRPAHDAAVNVLRDRYDVVETSTIDDAICALRREDFVGVFSDSEDFLPLERALVSQQATLVLNTIGEGVCIVDGEGRCNWMNRKMTAWSPRVHEIIRRTCKDAYDYFSKLAPADLTNPSGLRSKRYNLTVEDSQFLEMIASPVLKPNGTVVQIVAVVWDATSSRRLQQKIDAIDRAGREMMHLDADEIRKLDVVQRLKVLEDKIIGYTKELMHFDHFAIRLIDRKTNRLEIVMSAGLPPEALNIELFASADGNGISGFVAATGRSYICPDVERDPRYVQGLESALSSLTVPLRLHDKVIGIFNVESRHRGAFNEDDRQFAEIFGRYIAMALNTLDLMVKERVDTSHKIADEVAAEVSGPLNDIQLDVSSIMEDFIANDDLRAKLQTVLDNVGYVRHSLRQAAAGPNTTILGAKEIAEKPAIEDPLISGANVLVVDDEPNIRETIADVLRKYRANVTVCFSGQQAIDRIHDELYDLVLSDISMPDKSGYDVFLAASKTQKRPSVILMTGFGYDPSHCIVRASQEGLQAVLYKPFRVERLLEEVRKALRSRHEVEGHA